MTKNVKKHSKKEYDVIIWIRKNKQKDTDLENENKDVEIENQILWLYNIFYTNLNKVDDFFKLNNSILEESKKQNKALIAWFIKTYKIDNKNGEDILWMRESEFKELNKQILEGHILHLWKSIIPKSMLIYFHSLFENFLSKIFTLIFLNSPEQFQDNDIKFTYNELKQFEVIDDAKKHIIGLKISNILYSSIDVQIKKLSELFWIKDLSIFPLCDLIEISLRRNLFTHEDGIVNDIYINKCRQHWIQSNFKKWEKIVFEDNYFQKVYKTYYEFLIKIIFFTWIKLSHDEDKYDDVAWGFLNNRIFKMLQEDDLDLSLKMLDFILEWDYIKKVNESTKLMLLLNKAIVFKKRGDIKIVQQILKEVDWTAKSNLFKFAKHILLEEWSVAWDLMSDVIKKNKKDDSDYISDLELKTWPLFFEFKDNQIFKDNYKKIFWIDFILDV